MIAHVYSATTMGFEGRLIDVECDASNGLPNLLIVGLGNKAIDEAKERVRSAIKNSDLNFPRKRVTINLAPANIPKHGAHFDLPIALALLCISDQIKQTSLSKTLVVGELGLDGLLRPVKGVISYVQTAVEAKLDAIVVPEQNYIQACLVKGITIIPAHSLRDIYLHFHGEKPIEARPLPAPTVKKPTNSPKLDDIYGQEQAKRALLIAASGHHNLLLSGPPGAGKTMLAKALLSILPPLSPEEVIDVTKIHSLAGNNEEGVITGRPFRSPHHSASHVSIVGGGQLAKPGEVSLAHYGILFLDELPEYSRQTLEALRQPLEDKVIHISRAENRATYPANCMLVATQNPCPCGYAGDQTQECICSSNQILNYQRKVSGPLLDRIDLTLNLPRVEHKKLLAPTSQANNYIEQVVEARAIQAERFGSLSITNATMGNDEIKNKVKLNTSARLLLDNAASKLNLSARAYFKTIKVSRTIADIEKTDGIDAVHISEAIQYRLRSP